jgi:hypothetical protein
MRLEQRKKRALTDHWGMVTMSDGQRRTKKLEQKKEGRGGVHQACGNGDRAVSFRVSTDDKGC